MTSHNGIFYGGLQLAGADLGDVNSRNGIPVFSDKAHYWIQKQTGERAIFSGVYDATEQSPMCFDPKAISALWKIEELIPRRELESCVETFNASALRLVFPVISRELFRETIHVAYNGSDTMSASVISARTCVLAFVAMLSKLEPEHMPSASPRRCGVVCRSG